MARMNVGAESLIDGAVSDFCLTVSLGVMGGRHVELGAESGEEGSPELTVEAGITVGDEDVGETVLGVDVVNEDVRELLGGDGLVDADEDGLLGEHANEGGDGVVGVTVVAKAAGELGDEVKGDMTPGARGNGVRAEETRRGAGGGLDALTGSTAGDVGADCAAHAWPPEALGDGVDGLLEARVSSGGGVVILVEEALADVRVGRYAEAVLEVPVVVAALRKLGALGGVVDGVFSVGRGDGG
jgi:hypothetical protein